MVWTATSEEKLYLERYRQRVTSDAIHAEHAPKPEKPRPEKKRSVTPDEPRKRSNIRTIFGYLISMALVLSASFLGDWFVAQSSIPIPGPAVGLCLLFSFLIVTGGPNAELEGIVDYSIPWMPLLFVPSGVGVIVAIGLLVEGWIAILSAVVLGTAVTLVVCGVLAQRTLRTIDRRSEAAPAGQRA